MHPFHRHARLGRAEDLLPWNGRLFGRGTDREGFEIVDPRDTHTAALIADGSIVLEDQAEPKGSVKPREPDAPAIAEH